eukprot:scaffold23310_cov75-Phaeocystis_antarctica.AAC.6
MSWSGGYLPVHANKCGTLPHIMVGSPLCSVGTGGICAARAASRRESASESRSVPSSTIS